MEHRASNPFWAKGSSAAQIATAGEDAVPRLTPYLPHLAGPTPAVIVCPGGAYERLASHEGEPVARWLNTLGIAAFVLSYRVAPHQWPAPLEDVGEPSGSYDSMLRRGMSMRIASASSASLQVAISPQPSARITTGATERRTIRSSDNRHARIFSCSATP